MGDPPGSRWRVEEGPVGEAVQDVQGPGPQLLPALRLQGRLRWRPQLGLWHDLRQPRGGQEVRAEVPADAIRDGQGQGCGPQAAQGAEEPCEEGSRHEEGQDAGQVDVPLNGLQCCRCDSTVPAVRRGHAVPPGLYSTLLYSFKEP